MVHNLWRNTEYVAHVDSSSWYGLVYRACEDTKRLPNRAALADW